jgi:hypothetical protein
MKNKKQILAGLLTLGFTLAGGSCLLAQVDTVSTTTDTVRVIEKTTVIKEPIVTPPAAVPPPVQEAKEEEPPLRHGEFGVRFFPTFTALRFNAYNGGVVQGTATLDYGYGIMIGANFNHHFGLMAEVDYLGINQKYTDQELEHQVNLNYLNIPVMLQFNTDKAKPINLNLVLGPQFGINVGSSVDTYGNANSGTVQATVAAKGGDVGLAYGGGFEFALNRQHTIRLDLGFRGAYGLINISGDEVAPNTYNVVVNASRNSYGGYLGLAFAW